MRKTVAEWIVKGFHDNKNLLDCVKLGLLEVGEIADSQQAREEIEFHGKSRRTCREWLGSHHSLVADLLWDGAPDRLAIRALMTQKPGGGSFSRRGAPERRAPYYVSARRDKKHDWHTVK